MILETERLILRPWEDRDYGPMARIQGDPKVRRFFPKVMTPAELAADLDEARDKAQRNGFHMQAGELKATGELIGLIGIGLIPERTRAAIPSHPEVEVGWVLAERFWGRGLAVEGARAWIDHAWTIGLHEIVAFTARVNLPSQRVMQKVGMKLRPGDDYEHPSVPEGSALRPHVVYGISRPVEPASHRQRPG